VSRYRCPACGYEYDEERGHPREGFPAGTPWGEVPDDWACPDCGVRDKVDFEQAPDVPAAASPGSGAPAESSGAPPPAGQSSQSLPPVEPRA
jgi:rubredoxin